MRAADLIALLQQHPPGTPVFIFDERTGFPEPVAAATLEQGDPNHGLVPVLILEAKEPAT